MSAIVTSHSTPSPRGDTFVGLMGGIGNILFQIARGASLAAEGRAVRFFFVIPQCPLLYRALGWTQQPLWIDIAQLVSELGLDIVSASPAVRVRLGMIFLQRKLRLGSAHTKFDLPLAEALTRAHGLDVGYFQSPAHLSQEGISRVLTALGPLCDHETDTADARGVTVHMRGADVNKNEWLKIADIATVLANVPETVPVRVVGNDLGFMADLMAANLRPLEFPQGTAFSDFCTIVNSQRLILSSSTFGFWAAALANARRPCPIHIQEGAIFTRFPELFPDAALLPGEQMDARSEGTLE